MTLRLQSSESLPVERVTTAGGDYDVRQQVVTQSTVDKIKLFDTIDQTWTEPIDTAHATTKYLSKVVGKCSACDYVTGAEIEPIRQLAMVRAHLNSVVEQAESHVKAEVLPGTYNGNPAHICTGCDLPFKNNKGQGRKHLLAMQSLLLAHQYAEAQLIRRYALEPSAPVVLRTEPVTVPGMAVPEVSQVVQVPAERDQSSPQRRPRRRHRRRSGRRPT